MRSSKYMVLETKSMPIVTCRPSDCDADRLDAPTLYVLSNVSYIKRVMMDVLPTASSPRNTSLYLDRGTIEPAGPASLPVPAGAAVGAAIFDLLEFFHNR